MTTNEFESLRVCEAHVKNGKPLPAVAYTDEGLAGYETRSIFAASWCCIGVTDDVSEAGDVKPLVFGGAALLLTRSDDGTVHVHHNNCRHRGMQLAGEPCSNVKRLVCPYHGWIYGLDGQLLRTPHVGGVGRHGASDVAGGLPEGLKPVRSAIWNHLIFVNVSGDAEPFEKFIAPLERQWADYDLRHIHLAVRDSIAADCNWKLAVENFVDVYHLPFVHPGLNAYSDFGDHYYIHEARLFGEGNANVYPDDSAVDTFEDFPGLPGERRSTLEALCLFPNLLITITRDHLRVILVEPNGTHSCRERVYIFVNGRDAATSPELEDERQQLMRRFVAFNDEDLDIAGKLQTSMQSRFNDGCFSPAFDTAVRLFQAAYVECLGRARETET